MMGRCSSAMSLLLKNSNWATMLSPKAPGMKGWLAQGWRLTPVAPTSVAVALLTMEAPMTTPSSASRATRTGGMVSASRPL